MTIIQLHKFVINLDLKFRNKIKMKENKMEPITNYEDETPPS